MKEVVNRIQSRGYWHRVFRPLPFEEERVELGKLYAMVQQSAVENGWGCPMINPGMPPSTTSAYVGHVFEWEDCREAWRFYTSGQFVSVKAFMLDWREKASYAWPNLPGEATDYLGMLDAVRSFTAFYEFAARLAMSEAGAERVSVTIEARRLKGRTLISEAPHRRLNQRYQTAAEDFSYPREVTRTDLVAQPSEMALEGVRKLFQCFGCPIDIATLRGIADELKRR